MVGPSASSSYRARVRTWLRKLSTAGPLAFDGEEELKMLLDLYDGNPLHPIQYHFDNRFKGQLPLPDVKLCVAASKNVDRSRSRENFPTDEGLLQTHDGSFFNASTIEGKDRTYIATQHPLPSTVADFWKMILAEKPAVVVMLNKHEYDQVNKYPNEPDLAEYWPGTSKSGFIDTILLEDNESGGTVKISVLPEPPEYDIEELEGVNSPKYGAKFQQADKHDTLKFNLDVTANCNPCNTNALPIETNLYTRSNCNYYTTAPVGCTNDTNNCASTSVNTSQQGSNANEPTNNGTCANGGSWGYCEYKLNSHIEYSKLLVEYQGQQHQLWHIRCGGWKDQEAPDLDLFIDLWKLVQEKLKTHEVNSGEKHKLVIHCTGGVGRTGTFIAVDIAGQELKEKQNSGKWEEFSIEKVIHFLRKKRMNMVGSVSQYIFCHRAALNLFGELPP